MDSRIEPPFIPRYQPPTSQTYEPKDDELAEWAVDTNRPVSMDTSIPVDVSILPPFALSKIPSPLDHDKPTCTLKLICYRPGKQGCVWRWIKVYSQSRYAALPQHALQHYKGLERDTSLVRNDLQFFRSLQKEYKNQLCGPWRRCFSLKTLRQIRLLSYAPTGQSEVVPLDEITLREIFHAYKHPSSISVAARNDAWIDWVFRLRQQDRRHALEFVEGWSGLRIAVAGSVPWISATVVAIVWVLEGGDAQTAFIVAGFIMAVGTSLLALLAIVCKIES